MGDTTTQDQAVRHEYFVDIDPVTGWVLRRAFRFQYDFRFERNALFKDIVSAPSSLRCVTPQLAFYPKSSSGGFGCFLYHPVFRVDDVQLMDYEDGSRLQYGFYGIENTIVVTTYIAAFVSAIMIVVGYRTTKKFSKLEEKWNQRIYLD